MKAVLRCIIPQRLLDPLLRSDCLGLAISDLRHCVPFLCKLGWVTWSFWVSVSSSAKWTSQELCLSSKAVVGIDIMPEALCLDGEDWINLFCGFQAQCILFCNTAMKTWFHLFLWIKLHSLNYVVSQRKVQILVIMSPTCPKSKSLISFLVLPEPVFSKVSVESFEMRHSSQQSPISVVHENLQESFSKNTHAWCSTQRFWFSCRGMRLKHFQMIWVHS